MATKIARSMLAALNQQRRALGMSLRDVSERSGVPILTVRRVLVEQKESSHFGNVLAIASALGVDPMRAIPDPAEAVEKEIRRRAKQVVRMVQGTMGLEAQGLTDQEFLTEMEEKVAAEIRAKPRKQLWGRQCRSSSQSRAKRQSTTSPG